jgi:alpha/beta superfamily hydrolase
MRLAAEADRAQITDQYIGHVLAYAPNDSADKAWPHRAIRDLIELLASDDLEIGIRTERFNMRGVWKKEIFEGGKQERELATQALTWAKASLAHPRTSAMLRNIAEMWESSAEEADIRARQDQMKYE